MARTKKPNNSKSNVVSMSAEDGGNVAVAEPEPKTEPETPFDSPADQTPAAPVIPKKTLNFWQRVDSVPSADWGSRAFIYVYCLEPICDLRQGGEKKYLVRLQNPVRDENFLMADYGSGKYRLTLVHRKPAADKQDTVDTIDVEIYNPKYPPKIPRTVWMNDRRNDRWAALLPKEEPPQPPTPLGAVSDAFKTFTDIQKEIRESLPKPAEQPAALPPADRVAEFRGMLAAAKEMMPAPAPATDNKVLDTVVQLMMKQLDASQQETKELRQELRDMMKEQNNKPSENFESIIDKFEKIAPKIQGLLGLGGDKLTDVVHGRRRGFWEELALKAVEELSPGVNSLLTAGGQFLLAPKGGAFQIGPQQQAALPAPNGNGQQPQQQADPLLPLKQKVGNFLGSNLKPLQKHFEAYVKAELRDPDDKEAGIQDGSDFAIWIEENHGIEILTDARQLGADQITLMFQSTPAIWAAIKPHEQKFREFLYQVLAYTPEEGDEGRPVDLTEEK
jgi:hypothetical protein